MADIERVLIVVPAWNEEDNVGETVSEIRRDLPTADVLVVDDGSEDATADRALDAGALVALLPFNLGVGGAMRTGYRYALEHSYSVVVQVDADGQHIPAVVPELVAGLAHADLVIGARFAGSGDYSVGLLRRFAMRILARSSSWLCGTTLTDATSGFRAAGPRAVALFARSYPAEYLGDTVESTIIASRAGLSVTQIAVDMRPRRSGAPSQSSFRAALYLARALLVLTLASIRRPTRIEVAP